jgi:hypothetical protein
MKKYLMLLFLSRMIKSLLLCFFLFFCVCISQAQSQDTFLFQKNYTPGTLDGSGQFMGGTETSWLIAHKGQVFAGIGYWKDNPVNDPQPGPQILRKSCSVCPWQVDISFGHPKYLGLEAMASIVFTRDSTGAILPTPDTLLLASAQYADTSQPDSASISVWVRNDVTAQWSKTVLTTQFPTGLPNLTVRQFAIHFDKSNGAQYVFALTSMGHIFRGCYDASLAGKIRWANQPEIDFPAGDRWISWCVANDTLYAGIGLGDQTTFKRTALFRRNDNGTLSTWTEVKNWLPAFQNASLGLRGLTAITHPSIPNKQLLLASREHPGVIERIDPLNNYNVQLDFDQRAFFTQLWGSLGGGATIAAYNDMLPFIHPINNEQQWLISLWVNHPNDAQAPYNGSWFLIRGASGNYSYGNIYDPTNPLPSGEKLKACRTIIRSPFTSDGDTVFYFGGYDAGGAGLKHNTAWIYKGILATNMTTGILENFNTNEFSIYPNPSNTALFIKTENNIFNQYKIINFVGQLIIETNLNGNSIDVSTLQTGIYFLQLKNENGRLFTTKFIKE